MKKTMTLILVLLLAMNAGAQYFHHTYADGMTAGNGMVTKYVSDGHVIAGFNPKVISVVRTDVKGNFSSADNFNLLYVLKDVATGNNLYITGTKITELSTKDGYIAMGDYYFKDANGNIEYGIFYMLIKTDGNPSMVIGYQHPKLEIPLKLTAITESVNSPGDIYATGLVEYDGSPRDMFAMRIKGYGSLSWSYIYDFSYLEKPENQVWVSDILESPFSNDIDIVGRGNQDGLWIDLDQSNGSVQSVNFYDLGKDDRFNAIATSADPNLGKGYILCGTSTSNEGYNQVWAMKTKTLKTSVQWSYIYAGKATAKEQDGIDIIGRLNTGGKYEYYLAAVCHDYPNNVADNLVFKIPSDGVMTSVNDVFLYPFVNKNLEHVESIDIGSALGTTGISLYSDFYNASTGAQDMLITHAYFNGVTACNYEIYYGKPYKFTPKQYDSKTQEIEKLQEQKLDIEDYFKADDKEICYAKTVLGGSNARLAQNGITGGNTNGITHVYPNPLTNNATLHIAISAEVTEKVQVNITDMSGRIVWSNSYTLQPGDNDLQMTTGDIAAGIYDVSVARNSGTEHNKIAVH